ncbi:hypothetical protein JCM10212_004550 [Sporobolomyces blumeae]
MFRPPMSATISTHRMILLGATGATGKEALVHALACPSIDKVYSFGRRAPTLDPPSDKLIHQSLDFDKLLLDKSSPEYEAEARKLRDVDASAVLIALGTTRKAAGSAEAFEKIDREYVVKAAEAAKTSGKQRLVYLSAASSNSSSSFLYVKSKGLTEEALAALGYSETFIVRPGYLDVPGGRNESRLAESIFGKVMNAFSTFSDSLKIDTPVLGKALVNAAVSSGPLAKFAKPETLKGHPAFGITNAAAIKLGKAKDDELVAA